MNIHETELGFEVETTDALFFFGKKDATAEALARAYPFFKWARVRQTHSDIVVESPAALLPADFSAGAREADAHWTRTRELALLISTADCVPVLFADPAGGVVAAVHAGWRGVASRIVPKTIAALAGAGTPSASLWAMIGPHIQVGSFEVGDDVKDLLLAASEESADLVVHPGKSDKPHVDLNAIVKSQLQAAGLPPDQVFDLHLDTVTDERLHSHRRDREKAGRQLSFVVLKSRGKSGGSRRN